LRGRDRGRSQGAFLLVIILAMVLMQPIAGASWTQWRGSHLNLSNEVDPPPGTAALRWRFDTGNQVLSSPSFYDGGMVIGSDDGWLYCLDPATGELNWKFRAKKEVQSTALIEDDLAYFGSFDKSFYCVQMPSAGAQPRKVWSYECGGQILSSAHSYSDSVLFGCMDGNLYSLHKNGTLKWRTQIGNEIWASPLVDRERSRVYIGDILNVFCMLDADTGEVIERKELGPGSEIYSSPVMADGMILIGTGEGRSIIGLDKDTLEVVYSFQCGLPVYSTPYVAGDRIYFGSFEHLWCIPLDDDDGNVTLEEVLWSSVTHDYQGGSSPVVTGGVVIIGSDDYNMYFFDASDGSLLYNYTAAGYIYSSPVVHDGAVFFGSSDWSIYSVGDPGSGLLTVDVEVSSREVTSEEVVRFTVRVTDGSGAPVDSCSVQVLTSAGEAIFEGDLRTTGPDGTLNFDFRPFPVSSRSTLDITVKATEGEMSGISRTSLIVEPGEDGPSAGTDRASPYRPWYFAGIAIVVALNAILLAFFLVLRRKAGQKEGGSR